MPSLKKLNLKSLHSFFFAPKQAFTLVELIVVISVLGVLATIAFTQVSNVTQSARNSTRMTNIQSISSSLNIYKATNGTYPIPDNKTDILYSGTTIGYQGYIKDTAARLLKLSPTASQDPLNTSTYFSYATNQARTNAQLLGFLEANTTSFKVLPATLASDELATKTPYSKGEELGMLYTSGTTTPLAGTSIDLNTTTNPYTAYYNSTDSLSGTGNLLQNLVISYAHGSGFGSPSADDCPTGFIPVPGNKDFNQPGFCVAKYEMKTPNGILGPSLTGSLYATHDYIPGDTLVSTAKDAPIALLTQIQAIEACKSMGLGYHLVTNNEWMAIARDIEKGAKNWSGGAVGSGYIFNGHANQNPNFALTASQNDQDEMYGIVGGTGSGTALNNKRVLFLSNGSAIWDLAGNVYELVNKANNLDGIGYNNNYSVLSNVCGGNGWYSFSGNDGSAPCGYTAEYSYSKIGPATLNLTAANGIGRIYSYDMPSNVLLRGGDFGSRDYVGIFLFHTSWNLGKANFNVGFRCAK